MLLRPLLPVFSLFALASGSNVLSARDTGDSHCATTMCISAIVNDTTVTYVLQSTGRNKLGWMGMGFGRSMANSPMVITWANSDGSITISQRTAPREVMPTVDNNPPRVATLQTDLSATSGNQPKFAFSLPKDDSTKQWIMYAFGTTVPDSAVDATIVQHIDMGSWQFDLTKSLDASASSSASNPAATGGSSSGSSSGPSDDIPLTPVQRIIVVHAIFSVVGFLLLLPAGALLARYLRTFWPTWFTAHWVVQFALAGPAIVIGVALGIYAVSKAGALHLDDTHKKWGVAIFVLYFFQCALGAFIHFVKPKPPYEARKAHPAARRPLQNYLHAIIGLATIAFALFQVRTGYKDEWPKTTGRGEVGSGANIVWYIWVILLPVLYFLGLALLPRQFKQEASSSRNVVEDYDDNDRINMADRYRDTYE